MPGDFCVSKRNPGQNPILEINETWTKEEENQLRHLLEKKARCEPIKNPQNIKPVKIAGKYGPPLTVMVLPHLQNESSSDTKCWRVHKFVECVIDQAFSTESGKIDYLTYSYKDKQSHIYKTPHEIKYIV